MLVLNNQIREIDMSQKMRPGLLAAGLLAAGMFLTPQAAQAQDDVLAITSTAAMTTPNPYAESSAQAYSLWCQVYGCLGRYNFQTKEYEGILAESWEVVNDTTWRFTLRDDLPRHDGGPTVTSADVIHSWQRVMTDEASVQRFLFNEIEKLEVIDERTFDVVTKRPMAPLLAVLFDRLAITSKDLFEEHGKEADTVAPHGWGPYALEEYSIDQQIVISKHDEYPGVSEEAPDTAVFRQMREPEQRVTALLNGEVQIARLVPPQLMPRLEGNDSVQVVTTPSIEPMFVAMNPAFEPWDDVRVRRAVAHAIDKDLIIDRLLFGLADRLDGPLGEVQVCYDGPIDDPITYDPERARELLAEAGYADGGPAIDFHTANGRYISDRQIAEVITQMLTEVGFEVTLHAPEWANTWAKIRGGDVPMFYMGRGLTLDPSEPVAQYLQTGVTPRVSYSNPELDALFEKERQTFDHEERCQVWREIRQLIVDETPLHYMWTHRLVNGVAKGIEWPADASGEVWVPDVKM